MKSLTMLFTGGERTHLSWMLTTIKDQLLKQIIKTSIRPLCYFSWHITLCNLPQWIVVEVSKEDLQMCDWFSLPSVWWLLWCLCRDSYRRNLFSLCSSRLKLMSVLLWKVVQCHTNICHSSLWKAGGNNYLITDSSWSLVSLKSVILSYILSSDASVL